MEDAGFLIFIIILNLVLAFIFGKIGEKRRIGFGWAFVSILFLGWIGIIIVLCSKKNDDKEFIDVDKKDVVK